MVIVITAAIVVMLMFYILHELQINMKKKEKLPPGPRGLDMLAHCNLLGKEPHKVLCQLAKRYGPIMSLRFGSVPTIIISSPASAELVLKTYGQIFADRPHFESERYIGYGERSIGLGRYGQYWRQMRKVFTLELLSSHKINQFKSMRKSELDLLVSSIKLHQEKESFVSPVNLSERIGSLSTDMTCLMVFGKKYADDVKFKDVITETLQTAASFNVGDYFPFIGSLDLQGLNRRMKQHKKIFDGFFEKVIDDHVRNKTEKSETRRQNLLSTLISMMTESGETGFKFDRCNVKAALMDIFVAASDTSATTIDWTMSELIRNPTIMKKLQNELESVVGMDNMVEESHLEKLDYLNCIVKETFRLHPNVPLLIPHASMEDCMLQGYNIPKKSRVIVNIWAIGRDPNVWSDPNQFKPDRFIGSNIDVQGQDFQLLPFGSGRRGCPGMQLGYLVVRLVVAQLAHCFDWELPNGMKPYELDMSAHYAMVMGRANHLLAIPKYRLHQV